MNVENRKLFRNKDARSRLADMGGIIASSPELLGTVQKFQEAGPVAPSTFLVQLPGLVGGNEFLQLTAAELQLLNEKQPGLMTSEGVMIQEATPEILSNLNPAQVNTTDNLNIKRMFTDLGVELSQAPTVVEPESSGIISQIKSFFNKEDDTASSNAVPPMTSEVTTGQPPPFSPQFPGDVPPDAKVLPGNPDNAFGLPDPSSKLGEFALGTLNMPSKYYDAGKFLFDKQADLGKAIVGGVVNAPEYLMSDSEQLIQEREAQDAANIAFRQQEEDRVKTQGGLNSMSIAEQEIAQKKQNDEIARLEAEEAAAQAKKTAKLEDERSGALGREKEQQYVDAQDFKKTKLGKQVAAGGSPISLNAEKIKEEVDKGGSGSQTLLNTDKKLSPKESVKEFQSMYKDMLGMDDEDKEKEKWHQMAMIGFAIAAGQDPSALANIAGGLLEGTKMMKSDRARKQDREDKFTMMAIQSADEERRSLRDAGTRADERTQTQLDQIDLLELRGTLSAEAAEAARKDALVTAENLAKSNLLRDAAKYGNVSEKDKYLASESGKAALAEYQAVMKDASISEKDKLSTVAKRLQPAAAAEFQNKTGVILTGGSSGVGQGVTGTASALSFTQEDLTKKGN